MSNFEPSPMFSKWPGCRQCKHLHADYVTCDAYPKGVPLPIASSEVDHMVFRSDQVPGILFELKPAG